VLTLFSPSTVLHTPMLQSFQVFLKFRVYTAIWAQQVDEESDGLLHGPAGPPGPMASSALKDSEEHVRPHLTSHLVNMFSSYCAKYHATDIHFGAERLRVGITIQIVSRSVRA